MARALDILLSVRDQFPDPTYLTDGSAQPNADGALRQQELVRWLNDAQRKVSRKTRGILDWTAVPAIANQDFYTISPLFFNVEEVFYDGWLLGTTSTPGFFYRGVLANSPAWWASMDAGGNNLRIGIWPFGLRTPGTGHLQNPLGSGDTTFTILASEAANFGASGGPSLGFVLLGGTELVTYRSLNQTTGVFTVVTRGQGSTKAVSLGPGAYVQEANIWIHGHRLARPVAYIPNPTTAGSVAVDPGFTMPSYAIGIQDQLDIPDSMSYLLESYVLSKCREKEQDRQAAKSLMDDFNRELEEIASDPLLQGMNQSYQVRAYGPRLAYGRVIVP